GGVRAFCPELFIRNLDVAEQGQRLPVQENGIVLSAMLMNHILHFRPEQVMASFILLLLPLIKFHFKSLDHPYLQFPPQPFHFRRQHPHHPCPVIFPREPHGTDTFSLLYFRSWLVLPRKYSTRFPALPYERNFSFPPPGNRPPDPAFPHGRHIFLPLSTPGRYEFQDGTGSPDSPTAVRLLPLPVHPQSPAPPFP